MSIIQKIKKLRRACLYAMRIFISKSELAYCGKNSIIENPIFIENPQVVYLSENARIRNNVSIMNSPTEAVYIKKYTVIASHVHLITNNHRSTVGIPQFLLGASHINDKSTSLIINEDVWIGTGAYILPGANLGRGCIVAAGAIVTKPVPPYALVAGTPARIIAVKFSIEDIILHEQKLYKESERLSKEYLEELFEQYFNEKKVYGINSNLTEKEKTIINNLKQKVNFIEP